MAFEVQKIDPLDLQPSVAIGVGLPFSAPDVFTQTYQSKDAIKTNLINFFLTSKGERYMNPEFGNSLRELLFEQMTEALQERLKAKVLEDIGIYFPRVDAQDIEVTNDTDNNTIQFFLSYKVRDTNIEDELVINFVN